MSTFIAIHSSPQEESSEQYTNEGEGEEVERYEGAQIIEINPKSIEKLCRTCLGNLDLTPIDTTISSGEKVSFLLELCLSLKVDPSDPLPKNICPSCIHEIQRIYSFRKQCHTNESTLKQILASPEVHSDDDDDDNEEYDMKEEENSREEDEIATVAFNEDTNEWDHNYGKRIPKTESGNNSDGEVVEELIIRNDSNDEDGGQEEPGPLVEEAGEYFDCDGCDRLFASRGEMLRHRREEDHSKDGSTYMCEICSKMVPSRFKLTAHLRTHTKEKPFKCGACPSAFSLSGNLVRHMRTHTGEKPHICEFCGKGSIRPDFMLSHQNCRQIYQKPINELFNKCDRCGMNFRIESIYQKHVKKCGTETNDPPATVDQDANANTTVSDEQPVVDEEIVTNYICTLCHDIYPGRNDLIRHYFQSHPDQARDEQVRLTTDLWPKRTAPVEQNKPYQCDMCEKRFKYASVLMCHRLIHTGERPYECDVCRKRFVQHNHLVYHYRTHSGEKPYRCEFCQKDFSLKSNLTVHRRLHTGEKPYACSICDRQFYSSHSRNRHCGVVHGVDVRHVASNEGGVPRKHVAGFIDYKP